MNGFDELVKNLRTHIEKVIYFLFLLFDASKIIPATVAHIQPAGPKNKRTINNIAITQPFILFGSVNGYFIFIGISATIRYIQIDLSVFCCLSVLDNISIVHIWNNLACIRPDIYIFYPYRLFHIHNPKPS